MIEAGTSNSWRWDKRFFPPFFLSISEKEDKLCEEMEGMYFH